MRSRSSNGPGQHLDAPGAASVSESPSAGELKAQIPWVRVFVEGVVIAKLARERAGNPAVPGTPLKGAPPTLNLQTEFCAS